MHLTRLIFLLLQTTLFWISFEAYATPLTREQSGLIKLPLRRRNPIRRELHPQMLLQRHINRSHRRLARMTGMDVPPTPDSIGLAEVSVDTAYVVPIEIGTPPHTFHVQVDSGSADLWVVGEGKQNFEFLNSGFDGIMGLARSDLSTQHLRTVVESLAYNGLIQHAITSYKLSRHADQKNDGEITFGGLDTSKFDQNTLTTIPNINTQGFWEAQMDKVSLNGQDLNVVGRTAILDTGTTLLVIPSSDAQIIHQAIAGAKSDGNGGFTVPCTTNASLAVTFGGREFLIDPRDLTFAPVDPNNPTGDCVSGIAEEADNPVQWLVGDTFLKNQPPSTGNACYSSIDPPVDDALTPANPPAAPNSLGLQSYDVDKWRSRCSDDSRSISAFEHTL
ncbi:aspartic peptidase domain-containing protein [Lactifluus volemus]|nr:aspartic peptidase domain-containing protein [Lactifluus volemus]